ncbi:hypothetical protein MHYP_G00243960 [Metynnis hypsauchen]
MSTPDPEAEEVAHVLCDFYEENEDQLKTELKVFHSSFPLNNLRRLPLSYTDHNKKRYFCQNRRNSCVQFNVSQYSIKHHTLRSCYLHRNDADLDHLDFHHLHRTL